MAGIATIDVVCPRPSCTDTIFCDIATEPVPPKPGATTADFKLHITNLADRMRDHYREAHGIH